MAKNTSKHLDLLNTRGLCACGRPLHYTNPTVEFACRKLASELGPGVFIIAPMTRGSERYQATYRVQRHYIALHGISQRELDGLAKAGIIERVDLAEDR